MAIKHFPMAHARAAIATDPRFFGRGATRSFEIETKPDWRLSDDVKLFATTFAAGFLFVSIFIA
jgi:hypothetical protein